MWLDGAARVSRLRAVKAAVHAAVAGRKAATAALQAAPFDALLYHQQVAAHRHASRDAATPATAVLLPRCGSAPGVVWSPRPSVAPQAAYAQRTRRAVLCALTCEGVTCRAGAQGLWRRPGASKFLSFRPA